MAGTKRTHDEMVKSRSYFPRLNVLSTKQHSKVRARFEKYISEFSREHIVYLKASQAYFNATNRSSMVIGVPIVMRQTLFDDKAIYEALLEDDVQMEIHRLFPKQAVKQLKMLLEDDELISRPKEAKLAAGMRLEGSPERNYTHSESVVASIARMRAIKKEESNKRSRTNKDISSSSNSNIRTIIHPDGSKVIEEQRETKTMEHHIKESEKNESKRRLEETETAKIETKTAFTKVLGKTPFQLTKETHELVQMLVQESIAHTDKILTRLLGCRHPKGWRRTLGNSFESTDLVGIRAAWEEIRKTPTAGMQTREEEEWEGTIKYAIAVCMDFCEVSVHLASLEWKTILQLFIPDCSEVCNYGMIQMYKTIFMHLENAQPALLEEPNAIHYPTLIMKGNILNNSASGVISFDFSSLVRKGLAPSIPAPVFDYAMKMVRYKDDEEVFFPFSHWLLFPGNGTREMVCDFMRRNGVSVVEHVADNGVGDNYSSVDAVLRANLLRKL